MANNFYILKDGLSQIIETIEEYLSFTFSSNVIEQFLLPSKLTILSIDIL